MRLPVVKLALPSYLSGVPLSTEFNTKRVRNQMTKKDYELIARSFKSQIVRIDVTKRDAVAALSPLFAAARELATAFSAENPRFDTGRFLRACGVQA
jgi:hypothetical protein